MRILRIPEKMEAIRQELITPPPLTCPYLHCSSLEWDKYFCSNPEILHWILFSLSCSATLLLQWFSLSHASSLSPPAPDRSCWCASTPKYHLSRQQQSPAVVLCFPSQKNRTVAVIASTCSTPVLWLPHICRVQPVSSEVTLNKAKINSVLILLTSQQCVTGLAASSF